MRTTDTDPRGFLNSRARLKLEFDYIDRFGLTHRSPSTISRLILAGPRRVPTSSEIPGHIEFVGERTCAPVDEAFLQGPAEVSTLAVLPISDPNARMAPDYEKGCLLVFVGEPPIITSSNELALIRVSDETWQKLDTLAGNSRELWLTR